jgi:uncharacterized protein with HEPN domain
VTRPDEKRLDDVVAATAEIADIVGRGRGREAFDSDVALRRALERCLEIVGEAAKARSDEVRNAIPGVPWSQVVRLRDLLTHHYHRVEADQLWTTATTDVPGSPRQSLRGGTHGKRTDQTDRRRRLP